MSKETIWIITRKTATISTNEGGKSGSDKGQKIGKGKKVETSEEGRVAVPVGTIQQNMSKFLVVMGDLFVQAEQEATKTQSENKQKQGMQLDEIELSVEINGKGEVSMWGMGGGELGGKGAITLKFKRKES